VLQHFYANAYVFRGPMAYNEHADFLTSLPLVILIELVFIYLPISFHNPVPRCLRYCDQ